VADDVKDYFPAADLAEIKVRPLNSLTLKMRPHEHFSQRVDNGAAARINTESEESPRDTRTVSRNSFLRTN
jgi:hypothetical protein